LRTSQTLDVWNGLQVYRIVPNPSSSLIVLAHPRRYSPTPAKESKLKVAVFPNLIPY